MKYLPFEKLSYQTQLSPDEALERLRAVVEPKQFFRTTGFWGKKDHLPYEGHIRGNSFEVNRIPGYRNSFLPRIEGLVSEDQGQTHILITMKPHLLVIVFMAIWLGGVGIGGIVVNLALIINNEYTPFGLIPFAMFAFGYAIMTGGFKYESTKSKEFFAKLFEAEALGE